MVTVLVVTLCVLYVLGAWTLWSSLILSEYVNNFDELAPTYGLLLLCAFWPITAFFGLVYSIKNRGPEFNRNKNLMREINS